MEERPIKKALCTYFLGFVRSVTRLRLDDGLAWTASSLSLLQTLDPLHLDLGDGILHESVAELKDVWEDEPDEELRRLASYFDLGLRVLSKLPPAYASSSDAHAL